MSKAELNEYARWLSRNKSPVTVSGYLHSVGHYLDWLGGQPMTAKSLDKYIDFLDTDGIAPRSVARHTYAIRSYFKFLGREGELRDVIVPRFRMREPEFLTRKELDRLLEACVQPRDRAIVMLLYDAALRAGELVNIKKEDVDFGRLELKVMTEKARDGLDYDTVPICKETARALKEHIKTSTSKNPWMFEGWNGPITTSALRERLKRLSEHAGIKHVHPHMLRHSRATHIIQELGSDALLDVKKLLRHTNLQTTTIYTHLTSTDLKKSLPPAFPEE